MSSDNPFQFTGRRDISVAPDTPETRQFVDRLRNNSVATYAGLTFTMVADEAALEEAFEEDAGAVYIAVVFQQPEDMEEKVHSSPLQ